MEASKSGARHGAPLCGDFGGVSKRTGKPCGKSAGWNTSHKGSRRLGPGSRARAVA